MKIAFTTTLDDRYLTGFLITFNSILRSSPNFNYDLIVFEWGTLSDESKFTIKKLYDNVQFRMVDAKLYADHKHDDTWRKWEYNCNYRFDIFTLDEYDRVVFFDCDMIFQIDVEELLKYDVDFGATYMEEGVIKQIGNRHGFDAGLMTISKKYLGKDIRKSLLDIANSVPPEDDSLNSRKWTSDEPIINNYFLDKLTLLPIKYNVVISHASVSDFHTKTNFQYTGVNKPWFSKTNKNEDCFSEYTLLKLSDNNRPYILNLITKKLKKLVDIEINDLDQKGITI